MVRCCLSLEETVPILKFLFVKFTLPLCFRFLAVFAIVATFVVEKLALGFRSDFVAIGKGVQARALEAFGEFRRLFVVGATGEMRHIEGCIRGFGRGLLVLVVFFFCLTPFLLDRRLGVCQIKEVSDGGLHTPEIR
jgi:hypothetical protein